MGKLRSELNFTAKGAGVHSPYPSILILNVTVALIPTPEPTPS
jgi:hypothetical protein